MSYGAVARASALVLLVMPGLVRAGAAPAGATPAAMSASQSAPAQATAAAGSREPARSPRNANYSIDVELDPSTRTIIGREVITWRNITARAADDLQFHLYWNAWTNTRSTWMREAARGRRRISVNDRRPGDWAWLDVTGIRLLAAAQAPFADLTAMRRFIAPDDGNADDRTVMQVPLPQPVPPGQALTIEISWTAHVPRTFARTGAIGDFFFIAQWFPKIGVLQDEGWNTHQFHAGTEFFSDYGMYDVRITVPHGWMVGATGVESQRIDTPTGKTTWRFVQDDVHDFAWTTSPDMIERKERFEERGLPPVEMRLLLQPEHAGQADRHFAATRATLRDYGRWYGPYPYPQITIVDPAWQSRAGGMEYPTLFTAGTRWLVRPGTGDPESVTVHEAGHQFWYGLVGSNEFEHAWLDEGVNTFSTARVMNESFSPMFESERFFGDFVPWVYRDIVLDRVTDGDRMPSYRRTAKSDVPATPSWRYDPPGGGNITYAKTALWLHTLENIIGWPRLQRGLSLFFARHAFTHPTPDDFFRAVSEGAGTDLSWYFDQVYRSSNVLDYGIEQFSSRAAATRGFVERDGKRVAASGQDEPRTYETQLVVRRYGEVVLPVDVVVRFADGQEARERWDGRDRWRQYRWSRPARALSAAVDPEHRLVLDVNYTNNTWTLQPASHAAAHKWLVRWWVWAQDAVLTWMALV